MANSGLDFMHDRLEEAIKLGYVKLKQNLRGSTRGAGVKKGGRKLKKKLPADAIAEIRKMDEAFHTVNQIVERTGYMKKDVLDVINCTGRYMKGTK